MAESRERLTRPGDLAQVFAQRRSGTLGIFTDEAYELLVSPLQQRRPTPPSDITSTPISAGRGRGRENITPVAGRGRGRRTGSVLPSWYPRVPLQDITSVLRAIERRRARLGESDGVTIENPIPEDESERVLNSNVSSGAQVEHNFSTPASTSRLKKPCPPSSIHNMSKILLSVTNMNAEESELLTPQKRLLNSIDTVEKALMEEVEKMKRTPSAMKEKGKRKSAHSCRCVEQTILRLKLANHHLMIF